MWGRASREMIAGKQIAFVTAKSIPGIVSLLARTREAVSFNNTTSTSRCILNYR